MDNTLYPDATVELHRQRQALAPAAAAAFKAFGEAVFAAEMRAGGAYAHSNLALDTMNQVAARKGGPAA